MDEYLKSIDLKVKEHIIFTGFIDDEDLADVYGYARFFVYPSMYEGFGMPPLEAIACGTPVISSDAGSLKEVLEESAVLFQSQNVDELKRAIIHMNNMDSKNIQEYINKGKEQLLKYSWQKEASKLYKFLT